MADTTFVNGTTLSDADWFNDLNRLHYTILSDPADAAAVRTNLAVAALAGATFTGPVVVPNATLSTQAINKGQADSLYASISSILKRGYIDGLTISVTASSSTFTVAAGVAADSTNAVLMTLSSSLAKTTAAWSVGAAAGALDTGTIAANTWYTVYEIYRSDTGVVDILISLSASAPTMPTNYTNKRRIGSIETDVSSNWRLFLQTGDDFYWLSPYADFVSAGSTTASLLTVSVAPGVKVKGYFSIAVDGGAVGAQNVYLSDPALTDLAPSYTASPGATIAWNGASTQSISSQATCYTNTSGQIRHRELNTNNVYIVTLGWNDPRGKNL